MTLGDLKLQHILTATFSSCQHDVLPGRPCKCNVIQLSIASNATYSQTEIQVKPIVTGNV